MGKYLLIVILALPWCSRAEDYCFGFLNAHPDRKEIAQTEAMEIQKGHLAHMGQLGIAGHLLAAGPILTPGGPRGILIYRCRSMDQAREWTERDPAVQAKRLALELYRWRGPDRIGEPLSARLRSNPEAKYDMVRLPLLVFRKAGPSADASLDALAKDHLNHLARLQKAGKVRAAGPVLRDGNASGSAPEILSIAVFAAMPVEEATALAAEDKLVRDGHARPDAYLWMVADEALPKPAGN